MSDLQRYHCQLFKISSKNYGSSLGVDQNIELGSRRPISKTNCSSHYCHIFYLLLYIGESFEQNSQISISSRYHKIDFALLRHNSVINFNKRFFSDSFMRWNSKLSPFKSTLSVDIRCHFQFPAQRSTSSPYHRNISPSNFVQNIQCILSSIVNVRISSRGRHTNKLAIIWKSSHNNSKHIIMTWITIQPYSFCTLHLKKI